MYALVALKRQGEFQDSEQKEQAILARISAAKGSGSAAQIQWANENEGLAADALKREKQDTIARAKDAWDILKSANATSARTARDERDERRPWWLMAIRNKERLELSPKGSNKGTGGSGSDVKGSGDKGSMPGKDSSSDDRSK
jgi:hypothetical protein